MARLTDYTSHADAQVRCDKEALWALLDGDREGLNITHECLDRHRGRGEAVRVCRADGGSEAWSFDELADGASRFAHLLRARGIAPGERVAIMLEPSFAFYVGFFGAMKAGCVAVPLFTLFGPDGLRLRIDDCRPALIVTQADKEEVARAVDGPDVLIADSGFQALLAEHPGQFEAETASGDMAMYQYTSGTTRALPDAVKHRHRAIATVMLAALYGTGVRPGERFLCPSSPAWGHGLWHGTLAPLALGAHVAAWAGRFDGAALLQALAMHRIETLSAAATHYRMMKNAGGPPPDGLALAKLSFTGEPMDSATAEWCRATFGQTVRSFYGTTEVGVVLAGYPGAGDLDPPADALGVPLPGLDVAVRTADGRPCADGEVGEIMVRRGGDWVSTRDLGMRDPNGFFHHRGRADDVIISAGWTMSAVEIEDVLLKHPAVHEAAVIGVPDAARGQVVKAFIVTGEAPADGLDEELQTFTKTRLSAHEYPRQVAFVDALPKTPAGKVNRKVLREQEARKTAPDDTP